MKVNFSNLNFSANKMPQKQARYIDKTLKNSNTVDIICHETSDRDSVNSAIAIYDYLAQSGVNSRIILSQNLNSLGLRDANKNILQAADLKTDEKADTVLCVDFSAKDRVKESVLDYIKNANKILCIDHHHGINLTDHDYTYLTGETEIDKNSETVSSFYVDASAKSATSVIYRMFEALEEDISDETAYDLFYGLADDCVKRGLVSCDGITGTITPDKKLICDKNAYEIYENLENRLTEEQIADIARKIDIMANLAPEFKEFYESLFEKIRISDDGKTACVEIPPDDPVWKNLGGDNTTTSTILNRFRQNILNNEKFKNTENAIVFYEAHGNYRFSIHSKNEKLDEFYDLALKTVKGYDNFTAGGHKSRGGGRITSVDKNMCHKFCKDVTDCLNSSMS